MTITAYQAFNNSVTLQNNTSPTLCVQLRLPNTGTYVVFGRLVVNNLTALPLVVGVTNLDVANFAISPVAQNMLPGAGTCISLQSRLDVTAGNANEIVDIRCTAAGTPSGSNFALVT